MCAVGSAPHPGIDTPEMGPTKNKANRKVPVPKFMVPLLETEIGDQAGDALLFPSQRGGWLTVGELRWVFDPAAKEIGVEGLVPHELRHTCASLAIKSGANIKVVQHLLGHKTAVLTMDCYGHLYPDDLGRVATLSMLLRSDCGPRQGYRWSNDRFTCGFWCPR